MSGPDTAEVNSVSGCRPGAQALSAGLLAAFPGSFSMGCYNKRSVRGGATWSYHAGGRAIDISGSADVMGKIADFVYARREALGVEELIYNRRIWTAARAGEFWRDYNGENPHTDHVHIGISKAAADGLTTAAVVTIFGSKPGAQAARGQYGQNTPKDTGGAQGFGGATGFAGATGAQGFAGAQSFGFDSIPGLGPLIDLAGVLSHLADPNFWKRVGMGALGILLLIGGLVIIFKDVAADAVGSLAGQVLSG